MYVFNEPGFDVYTIYTLHYYTHVPQIMTLLNCQVICTHQYTYLVNRAILDGG